MNSLKTFPWGDRRRYNAIANRIRDKFGGRIQKVSVNAGFTCPNRDGTKGFGGCIYCNNRSFTPSYCVEEEDITSQINKGIEFLDKRYRRPKFYAAYFQAYSNTYKPLEVLKKMYNEALSHDRVKGIVVSTRPDCVNEEILDYLADLSKRYYVSVEYGIESCYNETLEWINRGHTFEDSKQAIIRTAGKGLHVTAHVLFGLPGESRDQMLDEAEILSALPINAMKFHHLQIIRDTPLAKVYDQDTDLFHLFTLEEYIDFIIAFLERLHPKIAVERLVSEAPPTQRLNPGWGNIRADWVQKKIESVMEDRDTWQGKRLKNPKSS